MLIKPGHSLNATLHRARGDRQPRGSKQITQEVKTPADPTDEGLVGMLVRSPAHIPDVIVGGIVEAPLAQPAIGGFKTDSEATS